jgi:hypothetical protein
MLVLVLAPAAIFVIALALALDVPRRLKDNIARLRPRSRALASVRG